MVGVFQGRTGCYVGTKFVPRNLIILASTQFWKLQKELSLKLPWPQVESGVLHNKRAGVFPGVLYG